MTAFVQGKINAINELIESGAASVTDPDGALIVTNSIGGVLGDGEGTVGLEVGTKAVDATEVNLTHLIVCILFLKYVIHFFHKGILMNLTFSPKNISIFRKGIWQSLNKNVNHTYNSSGYSGCGECCS